jgi:hypothetical protein
MEYERNTRIKETPRILFCLNCKREGHEASKCPYSRCYWCYGKRHITKNCPYGPVRGCNNCKKVGNINYHENGKYFCQNCYSKIITNKKLIKGTKAQEVFTYQRHQEVSEAMFYSEIHVDQRRSVGQHVACCCTTPYIKVYQHIHLIYAFFNSNSCSTRCTPLCNTIYQRHILLKYFYRLLTLYYLFINKIIIMDNVY